MTVRADLEKVTLAVADNASASPCSVHKSHQPEPLYTEAHHVIPQAWQHFWHPDGAKPDGKLFDPRTVAVCRTGHGNVHFLLVRLTRFFAEKRMAEPEQSEAETFVAELAKAAWKGVKHEHGAADVAQLGLTRWVAAGGTISALVEAGLYGSI